MVGTLLYISPEQINGRDADFRSDIYTLGISLFEAVTGRLPFERTTDYGLMHAHILESPTRPRRYKRDLPKDLEKVILKAIEKEPNNRLQTAAEFHELLLRQSQRYGNDSPKTAQQASATMNLGQRLTGRERVLGGIGFDVFLIGVVAVLVMALGLYPNQPRPTDEIEPVTRITKKQRPANPLPAKRSTQERGEATTPRDDQYDSLRKAWGG